MKHIIMLKDDRGQNDGQGEVKDYIAGREYSVGDGLAAAFESTQSCEILFDSDEADLLSEDPVKAAARTKAERKSKLKNK
jgi:hypothetical protein